MTGRARVLSGGVLALLAAFVLSTFVGGGTYARFSKDASNSGNQISSAADWTAPTISRTAVAGSLGSTSSTIIGNQKYFVYAQVTDTGNPASGVALVTANMSGLTTNANAVPLSSGSWTIDGNTYNYRSTELTARGSLPTGSQSYTVIAGDNGSYTRTSSFVATTQADTTPYVTGVSTYTSGSSAGVSSVTINRPPTQPGAMMVAMLARAENVEFNTPSGWTLSTLTLDGNLRVRVWTRIATASEPPSYTWPVLNAGQTSRVAAAIVSFSDGTNLIHNSVGEQGGSTQTHSTASLNITEPRRIASMFSTRADGNISWTSPSGASEIFDITTTHPTLPNVSLAFYEEGIANAGSVSSSATASVASNQATGTIFALR